MSFFKRAPTILCIILLLYMFCPANSDLTSTESNQTITYYGKNLVNTHDGKYYEYSMYISEGKLLIDIIDQSLTNYSLTFQQNNTLYYKASYKNFIIVEQKISFQETVTYWVVFISEQFEQLTLSSFPISSTVDNKDFQFENQYSLDSIIQYDQQTKFMYVVLSGFYDIDVYAIDVGKYGGQDGRLITVGWFYTDLMQRQQIVGGNSKVLVDRTKNQLYVDSTQSGSNLQGATNYKIELISELTSITLYSNSFVIDLVDSYFQYVTQSQDRKSFSGFVYYGYGTQKIYGQYSLDSIVPMKYFFDNYNFFMAISDADVYISFVQFNQQQKIHNKFTSLLSILIEDTQKSSDVVLQLNQALQVLYINNSFYALTSNSLYIYNKSFNYNKMALTSSVSESQNLTQVMFQSINQYNETK